MIFKSTNRGAVAHPLSRIRERFNRVAVPRIFAGNQGTEYQPRSGSTNTSQGPGSSISTAERLHKHYHGSGKRFNREDLLKCTAPPGWYEIVNRIF